MLTIWQSRMSFPRNRRSMARRGRLWRTQPTPLLRSLVAQRSVHGEAFARALGDVASASCSLGEPMLAAINAATVAVSVQLRAAGVQPIVGSRVVARSELPTHGGIRALQIESSKPLEPAAEPEPEPLPEPLSSSERDAVAPSIAPPETQPLPDLATLLAQLDALVGLHDVKAEIHRQAELLRVGQLRVASGLKSPLLSMPSSLTAACWCSRS